MYVYIYIYIYIIVYYEIRQALPGESFELLEEAADIIYVYMHIHIVLPGVARYI